MRRIGRESGTRARTQNLRIHGGVFGIMRGILLRRGARSVHLVGCIESEVVANRVFASSVRARVQ
eukprot:7171324-Lingulodinium_polyedra.AAC.1